MNTKVIIGCIVAVIVIALGVLLYKTGAPTAGPTPSPTQDQTDQNPQAVDVNVNVEVPTTPTATTTVQAGQTKSFTVTGSNFSFTPSTLTVNKGDKVKITFVNSGGTHDFKIDEFSVATKKISGGSRDVVEFTADKSGTFEFYCSVGSHRAMGMKGTLTVI